MPEQRCPRCDSPMADGRLGGQCPRCLGALAFQWEEFSSEAPLRRTGDYEFLRELGRGGVGVVYEARQRSLNRHVAVKMLLTGPWARPEFRQRFRAEAEAAARLRHPGIVTIHEVGELDGQPFIAMELVPGPSLADVSRPQPLPPARAARYVRLIAEAMAHAHAAGVLHRDLKPSNVLLDEHDLPRVTDFGLAKQLDSLQDATSHGELVGSPNYLPPEQVAGLPADARGDVYSLGTILYELLATRPPFTADSVAATLRQVVEAQPVPLRQLNASVPRDLETICLVCLRKEPARRYPTAAQLAADLRRFEAGEPILARPVSALERLTLWCRRRPALAAVSAALAATLLAGIAGVLSQWRRAESSRSEMALNLYAADVAAAAAALGQRNLGRARELLLPHAPPGFIVPPGRPGLLQSDPSSDPPEQPTGRPPGSPFDRESAAEFTWRLLWDRCRSDDQAVLGTHPWIVTCVAVSPDGRWLASGSQDQPDDTTNSLKLWSLEAPPTRAGSGHSLPSSNTIWSVAFTSDSRTLVSGGVRGVRFWDVASRRPRDDFPPLPGKEIAIGGRVLVASPNDPFFASTAPEPLRLLDLDTRAIRTLGIRGRHPALSPDGRRLALLDERRNIQLYDLATERLEFSVATNRLLFRLRFSPDGNRLAGAGQSTSARVWDLAAPGSPPLQFPSSHNVWDAAFTPDGAKLVTTTSHQQLELWNARDATPLGALAGHDNEVWTVAATPDGRHFVSGGKDRTVRLWPTAPKPGPPSAPHWRYASPAFSPDGTRLLTYAQTNWRGAATVWEIPKLDRTAPSTPVSLGNVAGFPRGFAPDGTSVLSFRTERPILDWRHVGTGEILRSVELAGAPTNLCLSEFALAGDFRSFACPDESGSFRRWSTEDGRELGRWQDPDLAARIRAEFDRGQRPNRLFRGVAASRTGRWLALGPYGDYAGYLVDFSNGHSVRLRGHRDDIAALAFSADETSMATGSVDGTIRLWSVSGGQFLGTLPGHLESVEVVAFSPDGRTLASINPGIEVTFWHLPTRRELARISHPEAGYHFQFSPDGRRLALTVTAGTLDTGTDRVELWQAP